MVEHLPSKQMVVGSIPISRSKQAVHCQTRQAKTHPGVYPRVLRADRSPNGPPKEANTVKKFLVIYHAPASAVEQMAGASAEDMQKGMEPWMAWAQRCGDSLVDMGSPLVGGQKIAESGSSPSDKGRGRLFRLAGGGHERGESASGGASSPRMEPQHRDRSSRGHAATYVSGDPSHLPQPGRLPAMVSVRIPEARSNPGLFVSTRPTGPRRIAGHYPYNGN